MLQKRVIDVLYPEALGESAIPTLLDLIASDSPTEVRLEAVHALGATYDPDALQALADITQDRAYSPRLRAYADEELARRSRQAL